MAGPHSALAHCICDAGRTPTFSPTELVGQHPALIDGHENSSLSRKGPERYERITALVCDQALCYPQAPFMNPGLHRSIELVWRRVVGPALSGAAITPMLPSNRRRKTAST
ncbi:hypothetical protein CISG_09361 [Coccidioides immitis RMSCC 3703]|uniref:Uncharacterized protein n=2 Tax=Coccidioides immitis TaxID=5501 RepID=A0A0J8RDB6_COCIT|nr:hypothetical protein CIRG_09428 [Coccidioides immitis RMSCC 2394]KMU81893.1 hypothetical protein CISG_09361 [Coccidioides immitis RMSCC 3703]